MEDKQNNQNINEDTQSKCSHYGLNCCTGVCSHCRHFNPKTNKEFIVDGVKITRMTYLD